MVEIPKGIRLLSWATTIRWIGWGFVEALIPVFLFSFANTYAETGLFRAVYYIFFILMLPIVGVLADRVASRTLLIIGALLYPFIGLSYFLAGALGFAFFIVIARSINGVSYALDSVARDTYFRRHAPSGKASTVFGYFETLANSWWIIALLASLLIIPFVKIHWMFLGIIPASLIAVSMILYLKPDNKERLKDGFRKAFSRGFYSGMFKEIKDWNNGLRLLGFLTVFLGFIATIAEFFIPIYSYTQGSSLQKVILIVAILALPAVFGAPLGRIADKKRSACIYFGLILTAALLVLLYFMKSYAWQLVAAFGIGIVLELLELTGDGITTRMTRPRHYGRVSGAMAGLGEVGNLTSPVILGLLIDRTGMQQTFLIMAIITIIVFMIIFILRKWLKEVPAELES